MSLPPLRYVVPVHNDAEVIGQTVDTLVAELKRRPPAAGRHEIALIENGSADASWEVTQKLAGDHGGVFVHAFQESAAGLGYALARGAKEFVAREADPRSVWIALTASDLPFGFSDLNAFEAWRTRSPAGRIAIGSKAHKDSVVPTTPLRSVMSVVFRAARFALIGMRTGDSQGTFFVRSDLMAEHHEKIVARDYFWTTELVYFSEQAREPVEELPVKVVPELRPSTVRPFKHGSRMFRALLELRARRR